MYRVFVISTPEYPRKEAWFDAVTVRESSSGRFWEFVDREGLVVARLNKNQVISFEEATDRRKAPERRPLVKPTENIWDGRLGGPRAS